MPGHDYHNCSHYIDKRNSHLANVVPLWQEKNPCDTFPSGTERKKTKLSMAGDKE